MHSNNEILVSCDIYINLIYHLDIYTHWTKNNTRVIFSSMYTSDVIFKNYSNIVLRLPPLHSLTVNYRLYVQHYVFTFRMSQSMSIIFSLLLIIWIHFYWHAATTLINENLEYLISTSNSDIFLSAKVLASRISLSTHRKKSLSRNKWTVNSSKCNV